MHRSRLTRVLIFTMLMLAGACATALASAATEPSAPSPGTPVIVYLAGGALAGGLVKVGADVFGVWRRKLYGTLGPDEELVSRITKQALEGAEITLRELRVDLEVAKRELAAYRSQIDELNRGHGAARAKIERLETDLTGTLSERDALRAQLTEARAEITELRGRIVQLESPPSGRRSTD